MTDNEIFEFKEMLFKKFSNEDVRWIGHWNTIRLHWLILQKL